jgi:ParB-like chromosome segregation protein Spo0J
MQIEEIDIDLIQPYKNNPREIPMESVQKVMNSIREFGNNQPIVVDNENVIVVGHTRWKALKQLGKTKAYIVKRDFSKNDAIAYRIMDNRSGEESKWENKLLAQELNMLKEDEFNLDFTGFNLTELENLSADKDLEFKANDKVDTSIDIDYPADMEVSHVKMVQLFLNTDTEKNFRLWVSELQKDLNTDNLTDTVYQVIKNAYDNSTS